jgi:hypothetical protein
MNRSIALASLVALLAACGGSSENTPPNLGTPGYYLVISGGAGGASFASIAAPQGATITIVNTDTKAHQIVSEATAGAFTPGSPASAPFDSGPFTGVRTFQLKTVAGTTIPIPEGTALPFYCAIHTTTEATPNGTITVRSAAPP